MDKCNRVIWIYEEDLSRHKDIYEILKLFYNNEDICFIDDPDIADVHILNDGYIFYGKDIKRKDIIASIYAELVKMFDYKPRFGMMTGMRPTNPGFRSDPATDIYKMYTEEYQVSEEAAKLLCYVISGEKYILGKYRQDDFVSVYISIPFCRSICSYCTFSKGNVTSEIKERYIDVLIKELEDFVESNMWADTKVKCIYIGGGTPGELSESQIDRLLDKLGVFIAETKEVTFEIGRPDCVTEGKLKLLVEMGIDRICINPQTTNEKTLKRINRKHTVKQFFDAVVLSKKYGFKCINTDLIFGFENEDDSDMMNSLKDVISLDPENLSIHPLAIKKKREINIRERNQKDELFWYNVMDTLHINNYFPYYIYRQKSCWNNFESISFAKKGSECLYNMAMTEGYGDMYGFGLGASSRIGGVKTIAVKNIDNYLKENLEM